MNQMIVTEVLKGIRGENDCMSMSKKLGYSYNQYFKFEAGYKVLRLNDFFKICSDLELAQVHNAFKKALDIDIKAFTQEELIHKYCEKWGQPSEYVLEKELNISTSKWWRIKNNKSALSFSDFLKIIDVTSGKLYDFLNFFIDDEVMKKKILNTNEHQIALNFMQAYPESALILTGVYINKYIQAPLRDKMKCLQEITGLGDDKFDFLIENLITKGICYTDNKGNIKASEYKQEVRDPDAGVSISLFKLITDAHQQASHTLGTDHSELKCNMKIASISPEGKEKIVNEMREYYQKISTIVENDPVEKRTELFMYQQGLSFIDSQK